MDAATSHDQVAQHTSIFVLTLMNRGDELILESFSNYVLISDTT
jgi:hypothetical protein